MNVGDLLKFFSKRDPNKVALYYLDKAMTYEDLNRRANKLGNGLLSLGFQGNDKVAILMQNWTPPAAMGFNVYSSIPALQNRPSYKIWERAYMKILNNENYFSPHIDKYFDELLAGLLSMVIVIFYRIHIYLGAFWALRTL